MAVLSLQSRRGNQVSANQVTDPKPHSKEAADLGTLGDILLDSSASATGIFSFILNQPHAWIKQVVI